MPTGTYKGWVILWRQELPTSGATMCDPNCAKKTTVLWALNPAGLDTPVAIRPPSPNPFASNIFCSGISWDRLGQLAILGGVPEGCQPGGGPHPPETYRFRPTSLDLIIYTVPGAPSYYPGKPGEFTFLRDPVLRQCDMAIGRYYPGPVQTLGKTTEFSTGGTIEGGLTMVIGGPPHISNEGNEIWEVLKARTTGAVAWEKPFLPTNPTAPDNEYGGTPNSPHYVEIGSPQLPLGYDPYARLENPPLPYPDRLIDSYPRMFQMPGGDILICGDVDSLPTGAANAPGSAWVIRPDYQNPAQPTWRSYKGFPGVPFGTEQLWHDSYYDCAVLLQQLTTEPNVRLARVLMFGGSRKDSPAAQWAVNDEIWEFRPNGSSVQTGTRSPKFQGSPLVTNYVQLAGGLPPYPVFKRMWAHGVVLPTGEVFVVGGSSEDDYQGGAGHNTGDTTPVPPVIYDPGPHDSQPQDDGIVYEQPNTVDGSNPAVTVLPRLYHSIAVLLADGRVLVGGGKREYFQNEQLKPGQLGDKDPRYTGQAFSPPYLDLAGNGFAGRPVIDSAQVPIVLSTSPGTFQVDVTLSSQTNSIDRIVLLRPAADTHSFDSDQRYVELSFTTNAPGSQTQTLTVTPPSVDEIPPGYYMLFVIESDGSGLPWHRVPSRGEFVLLQT